MVATAHARLLDDIAAKLPSLAPAEQLVARYILAAPYDLLADTAASLAAKAGVSAVTVGRLCRRLGARHLRDLKKRLRDELSAAPWVNAVELAALRGRAAPDERLSSILEREQDALGQVYGLAGSPDWIWAVERLAHAPIVAVAGFQTERGVAAFLTHNLRYVRPNVRLVDVEGGHFADALKESQETFLVVIETRRYSRQARLLLSEAEALDLPALVLTDLLCPWASADNRRVLRVEIDVGMVWPSMVALMAAVSLLLHDAVLALGPEVSARLDWISRSYQSFVGHQSVARKSNS